jgi:hypothetical protein
MKVYKKQRKFYCSLIRFHQFLPSSHQTQNMSTPTSTNPTTKVYNMGGNELNHSAIKGIIWNILDERPHKVCLNKTHKTNLV